MRQILLDLGDCELFGFSLSLRVFGYGFMLVLGFLCSVLLARWRARRAGQDPETISQFALLALIGGILGARLLYVLREWDHFAEEGLASLFDISSGGLVYFGGLIGGAGLILAWMLLRKMPVRRFMDIIAPSLMLGLAFGRVGCLLNGCCWGGPADPHFALHTRLPMVSRPLVRLGEEPYAPGQGLCPAYGELYWQGRVHPDPRLLNRFAGVRTTGPGRSELLLPPPLPPEELHGELPPGQLQPVFLDEATLRQRFAAVAGTDGLLGRAEFQADRNAAGKLLAGCEFWDEAVVFDQPDATGRKDQRLSFREFLAYRDAHRRWLLGRFDTDADGRLGPDERAQAEDYLRADLYALLAAEKTPPRLPAQLLGILNGLILCGLLNLFYRHRLREGRVLALMLLLYPLTRFILESIRSPNALAVMNGDLTDSQVTSIVLWMVGVLWWMIIGRLKPSAGPVHLPKIPQPEPH